MKRRLIQHKLIADTVLLLTSNIFVKGLGFLYRAILVRRLGTEGMGLIEMTSPLFSFLLVLSGLGIQTAMTQSIADDRKHAQDYFKAGKQILLISGLSVLGIAFLLSKWIVQCFSADERIYLCFLCLLPAIAVISFASAYRGYLQGIGEMHSIAASQNTEQIIRSAFGIWMVYSFHAYGLSKAVCASALATVAGETAGLIVLLLFYRRINQESCFRPYTNQYKTKTKLLSYGLPLTIGRLLTTVIVMIQAMLIPLLLQKCGLSVSAATEAYGRLSGVAMSLVHLPGVFSSALSAVMMPAIAGSDHTSKIRRIENSVRITVVFSLPGMVLLYLFAKPYCVLIFDNEPAAACVRILALGGLFLYLQIATTTVLQGIGAVKILLLNSLCGGIILIGGVYVFIAVLGFGECGAAWSICLGWFVSFLLNWLSIKKKFMLNGLLFRCVISPLLSISISVLIYRLVAPYLNALNTIAATMSGTFIVAAAYIVSYVILERLLQRN